MLNKGIYHLIYKISENSGGHILIMIYRWRLQIICFVENQLILNLEKLEPENTHFVSAYGFVVLLVGFLVSTTADKHYKVKCYLPQLSLLLCSPPLLRSNLTHSTLLQRESRRVQLLRNDGLKG